MIANFHYFCQETGVQFIIRLIRKTAAHRLETETIQRREKAARQRNVQVSNYLQRHSLKSENDILNLFSFVFSESPESSRNRGPISPKTKPLPPQNRAAEKPTRKGEFNAFSHEAFFIKIYNKKHFTLKQVISSFSLEMVSYMNS